MGIERQSQLEKPTIQLVTKANQVKNEVPCTPSACTPNVACNPNTDCYPFNCAPALRPCMPECAPSPGCPPVGR